MSNNVLAFFIALSLISIAFNFIIFSLLLKEQYKSEVIRDIYQQINNLYSEIRNFKLDIEEKIMPIIHKDQTYTYILEEMNKNNKDYVIQAKELNDSVTEFSKTISLIDRKQANLDLEFKEMNKHLDLIKSNLLIDNYNKGKKE